MCSTEPTNEKLLESVSQDRVDHEKNEEIPSEMLWHIILEGKCCQAPRVKIEKEVSLIREHDQGGKHENWIAPDRFPEWLCNAESQAAYDILLA